MGQSKAPKKPSWSKVNEKKKVYSKLKIIKFTLSKVK